MILDDLFEQKPLPPHIKASDLPPGMRPRLTMRDIERERPRGAYRYRVIPSTPGESPKDFVDLPGAEQYAQAVRGRVQPLEEQVSDPDVQRGIENLDALERNANNDIPVEIQNETGRAEYQIEKARDKQWVINHAREWVEAGRANDLYQYMGNSTGFEFLLRAWQKEDAYRSAQSKREKFEPEADPTPDLYGAQALGTPRAPRYQSESARTQKKRTDLEEAPKGASARTERMLAQMRARQPQATSDLEALAYELQDAEKRDAEEINKLEREVDSLETDIKSDLQKRIATLTRRRGGIRQAAAADSKIDATLDQLSRVNDQQQRDINDLTKAVASIGQSGTAAPQVTAVPVPAAGQPQPRIEVPYTPRTKTVEPAPVPDVFQRAVVEPLAATQRARPLAKDTEQPAAGERVPKDLARGEVDQVAAVDPTSWKKVAEAQPDMLDRAMGWVGREAGMARGALGTLGRAIMGRSGPSDIDPPKVSQGYVPRQAATTSAVASTGPTATPAAAPTATAGTIIQPTSYGRARTAQQQTAMQDLVKQAQAMTAAQKAAAMPQGWRPGMPIKIGKETITPKNPNYQKIAAALGQQSVTEKKKPVPTNPDLWSRAKSAARSKFDVYPSAYANAWAAKWYKSKGGGWRMGKPKKK